MEDQSGGVRAFMLEGLCFDPYNKLSLRWYLGCHCFHCMNVRSLVVALIMIYSIYFGTVCINCDPFFLIKKNIFY